MRNRQRVPWEVGYTPSLEVFTTVSRRRLPIRYTFADASQSYDELLAHLPVGFLSLVVGHELTACRLALSSLNSAARTKLHLLGDHLKTLQHILYKETFVNPDLVRTVQMGPWTHKVDDGLETRKTAYETMYTLLDTCLAKLDLHTFLSRVIPGLADDSDEIKVISHMMLFRLSQVAPTAVAQRLDEATPQLEKTMNGSYGHQGHRHAGSRACC
ncbi:hypothetical protein NMY22_g6824 [Coprinellus aureogranulatus]|nr:hypothetical protein NMY22_g6824 [Coprinellus aureogranulatus]